MPGGCRAVNDWIRRTSRSQPIWRRSPDRIGGRASAIPGRARPADRDRRFARHRTTGPCTYEITAATGGLGPPDRGRPSPTRRPLGMRINRARAGRRPAPGSALPGQGVTAACGLRPRVSGRPGRELCRMAYSRPRRRGCARRRGIKGGSEVPQNRGETKALSALMDLADQPFQRRGSVVG